MERREDNKKRFIIIDGSSLMYRAFFALPLLTSSNGIYTNAIMGFANMLGKILTEYKPDNIVVAFDKSRQTFRTQMYAEYKGQREKTPDELKSHRYRYYVNFWKLWVLLLLKKIIMKQMISSVLWQQKQLVKIMKP